MNGYIEINNLDDLPEISDLHIDISVYKIETVDDGEYTDVKNSWAVFDTKAPPPVKVLSEDIVGRHEAIETAKGHLESAEIYFSLVIDTAKYQIENILKMKKDLEEHLCYNS